MSPFTSNEKTGSAPDVKPTYAELEQEIVRLRAQLKNQSTGFESGLTCEHCGKEPTAPVDVQKITWQQEEIDCGSEVDVDNELTSTGSSADDDTSDDERTDTTSCCESEATSATSWNEWAAEAGSQASGEWDDVPREPLSLASLAGPRQCIVKTFLQDNELAERVQVLDDKFEKSDAAHVRIESGIANRLIGGAAGQAGQIIFRAWNAYASDRSMHRWDIPAHVSFARGDLKGLPGRWADGASTTFGNSFAAPSHVVAQAIDDVYDVRNAWAHPGPLKTLAVDRLLASCHRLAVVMEDEAAAVALGEMRDELRREAEAGLHKIECGCWAGERPPFHIEWTYEDCLFALADDDNTFPAVIITEAEEWREVYDSQRGQSRWDRMTGARVEENDALLESAEVFSRQMNKLRGRSPRSEEAARQREIIMW